MRNDITKEKIFARYNAAVSDFALVNRSLVLSDNKQKDKSLSDCGEAISQTLEWALKYHMNLNAISIDKHFNTPNAIRNNYWDLSGCRALWSRTVEANISRVNFSFLANNKNLVTNDRKHNGGDIDYDILQKYLEQTKLFINDYIDNQIVLDDISKYEENYIDGPLKFYSSCDKFSNDDRKYVLITGKPIADVKYYLSFGKVNWSLIISIEQKRHEPFFFENVLKSNGVDYRSFKLADKVVSNDFPIYSDAPSLIHANGFGTTEKYFDNYREWNKARYSSKLESFVSVYAKALYAQKVIIVCLLDNQDWVRYFIDLSERNFDYYKFVISTPDNNSLRNLASEIGSEIEYVDIDVPTIDQCFEEYISTNKVVAEMDHYTLPCRAEGNGIFTIKEYKRLSETFEVLYSGCDSDNDEDKEDFLRGHDLLTWQGARRRFAQERSNFYKNYVKTIESLISHARGQLLIIHEPGFGGTTVARQLAWHFHKDFPVLFLKQYNENVVSQLQSVQQKTRTIVIVFMEIPSAISYEDFKNLSKSFNDTRPFIFIGVQRGKYSQFSNTSIQKLPIMSWGNDVSILIDAYKPYILNYPIQTKAIKEKEFQDIINSTNSEEKKTPFYIGLLTFDEQFEAIDSYILHFVDNLKDNEQQKKAIIYLAICDEYAHRDLPESVFKSCFMSSKDSVLHLEDYFEESNGVVDFLLRSSKRGNERFWSIRYPLFSKYLIRYLLRREGQPIDNGWIMNICKYCRDMIVDFSNCNNQVDYLSNVLKDVFIGNSSLRDTDFSDLMTLLPKDDKCLLFKDLYYCYPDNAHFCSHLGRYYAKEEGNKEEAMRYADEALKLNNEDPLLHHIKGTCIQSIMYDCMERCKKEYKRTHKFNDEELFYIETELFGQAAFEFSETRRLFKEHKIQNAYGYITHIQLIIKLFEFSLSIRNLKKIDVVSGAKEPYFSLLEDAQNLLEEVKHLYNGEENIYVQECTVSLWNQYEDCTKIIQQLENQLKTTKYPAMVRRQMARIYIYRNDKYKTDEKVNKRILNLLNENFLSEPTNDKNFYLWFTVARYSRLSNQEILSTLNRWRILNPTLDTTFYCYVFNVIKAIEGSSDSATLAKQLYGECYKLGGNVNTYIREYYGPYSHNIISSTEFNSNKNIINDLYYLEGYVSEYVHDGKASIMMDCGLEVFFKPVTSKLDKNCLNHDVKFKLGFCYDGLRAVDGSVIEV